MSRVLEVLGQVTAERIFTSFPLGLLLGSFILHQELKVLSRSERTRAKAERKYTAERKEKRKQKKKEKQILEQKKESHRAHMVAERPETRSGRGILELSSTRLTSLPTSDTFFSVLFSSTDTKAK